MYPKFIEQAKKEKASDTAKGEAPDKCPICNAPKKMFKKVD